MKLYIECCKVKDKDKTYTALKVDTPYKKGALVSMETDLLLTLADLPPSKLYSMKAGDVIPIFIDNK